MQTTRPNPRNPNVLEVFEERPTITTEPDYRPGRVVDEGDPSLLQGDRYGKRPKTTTQSASDGLYIADAEAGTPLDDPFNMEALRRFMKRKIELDHQPVISFVYSVAYRIGAAPDAMLANKGLTLDAQALTARDLLSSPNNTLSEAVLVQALAHAVVELLKGTKVAGAGTSDNPIEVTPQTPMQFIPVKKEPVSPLPFSQMETETEQKATQNRISEALYMMNEHIGVLPFRVMGQDPLPAAARPGAPLMQEVAEVLTMFDAAKHSNSVARWVWNSLPENCGLAIVNPSVATAMEDCAAAIREFIPRVQMWHLITGPHVRDAFAEMVGSKLNKAPGELQYPHHQSSRGAGVVTGTRMSSGKWAHERAAQTWRKQVRWFSNVSYGPAEAWTQLELRIPEAKLKVKQAQKAVEQGAEELQTQLADLWARLLRGDPEYAGRARALNDLNAEYAAAKVRRDEAGEWYKAAQREGLRQGIVSERARAVEDADVVLMQIDQRIGEESERFTTAIRATNNQLVKAAGLQGPPAVKLYQALQERQEEGLELALLGMIKGLTAVIGKPSIFARNRGNNEEMALLSACLNAATFLQTAIATMRRSQQVLLELEKAYLTFREEDKVELFHHTPIEPPYSAVPYEYQIGPTWSSGWDGSIATSFSSGSGC
jgi:hypothetical protein